MQFRLRFGLAVLTAVVVIASAHPVAAQPGGGTLRAAAGKVDITPSGRAFIAGYGQNRRSTEVHDRLMARCLVLQSGATKIAFVSCDLIGLPRHEIQRIRERIKLVPADHVIIAATHTHSGPDTVGQWGPDIRTRGVDETWMETMRTSVAHLVDTTAGALQPAALSFAAMADAPGISKNIRVPRILDTELAVMQVKSAGDGKVIGLLVNFACHPEVLNTRSITADFPHWLYDSVESKTGGVCLYMNGAQGGMITADYDETTAPKGENWAAAEMLGKRLGEYVLQLLPAAAPSSDTAITVQRRVFQVPLENKMFKALITLHVFTGDVLKAGNVETEVNRITIGKAEFLTIPGEALPNVGLYLKRQMSGSPRFLLGLTCDFLGYILTPEDYGLKLYQYETSVSVGPQMEPQMVRNLLSLMPAGAPASREPQ